MQSKLTKIDILKILLDYYSTGQPLANLAVKYRTHKTTISEIITRGATALNLEYFPQVETHEEVLSFEDLLAMPDRQFYGITGLDPANRWWVGKGKMIDVKEN